MKISIVITAIIFSFLLGMLSQPMSKKAPINYSQSQYVSDAYQKGLNGIGIGPVKDGKAYAANLAGLQKRYLTK